MRFSIGGLGCHAEVGERKRTTSEIRSFYGRKEGRINRDWAHCQDEDRRGGGDLEVESENRSVRSFSTDVLTVRLC